MFCGAFLGMMIAAFAGMAMLKGLYLIDRTGALFVLCVPTLCLFVSIAVIVGTVKPELDRQWVEYRLANNRSGRCDYSLRGTRGAVGHCPECGKILKRP